MEKNNSESSDRKRIEQLEKRVEYLENILDIRSHSEPSKSIDPEINEKPDNVYNRLRKRKSQSRLSIPVILKENWLYWLGVGLLLIGVVFLFRYSVEQGWLIPSVRSAFGLITGIALLALGFNTRTGESIRQFLLGGGIAVLYITGFATFQLYSFISYPIAFGFMVAVTALSFAISVQQNSSTLSLLGTVGGLATPFLLYRGEGSLDLLMLYSLIIMTGSTAVYMFKKWGALLWSLAIGGSLILVIALIVNIRDVAEPSMYNQWTLQWSVIYILVLIWILPVMKEIKTAVKNSVSIPTGSENIQSNRVLESPHVQALSVLAPLLAVLYTHAVWNLPDNSLGFIALSMSILTGSSYFPLKNVGLSDLSYTHLFSAFVLFTMSLFLFFDGNILLTALMLEALALRFGTSKYKGQVFSLSSHFLVLIVWLMMAGLFVFPSTGDLPLLSAAALSELFVLAATGLMMPLILNVSRTVNIYCIVAHVGFLGWLAKELTPLDHGQMITSVVWGIYAIAILVLGFGFQRPNIRRVGMATILLVVGKLFFVDLSQTSALLRIPLFMGFGVLFLLIGYFLQKYWSGGVITKTEKEDKPNLSDR